MEKELDNGAVLCYDIDKSQKGLDCKQERRLTIKSQAFFEKQIKYFSN
jgi:hypothetical protein